MDDRAGAGERCARGDAGHRSLGYRQIDHPVIAIGVLQPAQFTATLTSNVFAEYDDGVVARHFLGQRLVHGFDEAEFAGHPDTPAGKPG